MKQYLYNKKIIIVSIMTVILLITYFFVQDSILAQNIVEKKVFQTTIEYLDTNKVENSKNDIVELQDVDNLIEEETDISEIFEHVQEETQRQEVISQVTREGAPSYSEAAYSMPASKKTLGVEESMDKAESDLIFEIEEEVADKEVVTSDDENRDLNDIVDENIPELAQIEPIKKKKILFIINDLGLDNESTIMALNSLPKAFAFSIAVESPVLQDLIYELHSHSYNVLCAIKVRDATKDSNIAAGFHFSSELSVEEFRNKIDSMMQLRDLKSLPAIYLFGSDLNYDHSEIQHIFGSFTSKKGYVLHHINNLLSEFYKFTHHHFIYEGDTEQLRSQLLALQEEALQQQDGEVIIAVLDLYTPLLPILIAWHKNLPEEIELVDIADLEYLQSFNKQFFNDVL